METHPLEVKVTASRLRELAHQGHLTRQALERAFALIGHIPSAERWGKFLNYALLVLGPVFTVSGIFFFFAYNWATLPRFLKFGLIEAAMLIFVGLAAYLGLTKFSGKTALLAAACMVGVLQAVYGQVYQTGADAYQLFLGWAALIIGWVVISAYAPLWFMWLVLLNLSLATYGSQVLEPGAGLYVALFALNAIGLFVWEGARHRGGPWLAARWPVRLIACAAFGLVVIPTLQFIFIDFFSRYGSPVDTLQGLAPVLYASFTGLILFFYSRKISDLFILTVAAFSLVVVLTAFVTRTVFRDIDGLGEAALGTLCVGGAVIGQMTLAFYLLRKVAKPKESSQ